MQTTTDRDAPRSLSRRWLPLIGLTAIVAVGSALGLWMVFTAVTASTSSPAAAAHDDTASAAHEHDGAGTVAMPGLNRAGSTPTAQPGATHRDGAGDKLGVDAEEKPGSGPGGEPGDLVAGMSDEEMAALGHTTDTHTSAPDPADASGRPLAATVAGFGVVNAAVLIAALLVGRSRRRPGQQRRVGAGTRPPTRPGASPPGAPRRTPSPTQTAGSPS